MAFIELKISSDYFASWGKSNVGVILL